MREEPEAAARAGWRKRQRESGSKKDRDEEPVPEVSDVAVGRMVVQLSAADACGGLATVLTMAQLEATEREVRLLPPFFREAAPHDSAPRARGHA